MRRTTFKIPWWKLPNLLGMKLTTDELYCFFQEWIMIYFFIFMLQRWNMKLTESTNICCTSDRYPVQLKWISKKPLWETLVVNVVNGLQSENKTYYLTKLVFSERTTDFCDSVPTLGNPSAYVQQKDVKVLQSIITWYMNLLTLSYPLRYAKRLVT